MDDRPAYPCCCFLRAGFSGCFEKARLEASVCATLRQHPLLTARVARCEGQWTWMPVDNPQIVIKWSSPPPGDELPPATRIDLTEEIGIRFQVLVDGARSTLILQFHHAACDGAGIFQFLHDLLIEYATARALPTGEAMRPRPALKNLARRRTFGLTIAGQLAMVPRQIVNLWKAWAFVRRLPSPLLLYHAVSNQHPIPNQYPAAVCARLTSEETAALRPLARQLGVTTNDLILRDTFLACHEWRRLQGSHREKEWLRISVPMNLRKAHDRHLPAANFVSMVFLDRNAAAFADPTALLGGVHREMSHHKQRKMGDTFSLLAALGRRLPGGLKKHLWADKCLATSVLTNLGTVFLRSPLKNSSGHLVAGGMTLETIDTLPPLRPYMAAGFAVGIYAGRLWITLHHDPRHLKQAEAQKLMEILLRQIRSSINSLK